MQTYVSFLRGINVGGRIIRMADLKTCYEAVGFTDVKTYLQSGNVRYSSAEGDELKIQATLEKAISEHFKYPAKVFVFKRSEVKQLVDAYPHDNQEAGYHHYIVYLRPGLAPELMNISDNLDAGIEEIAAGKDVVFWKVLKGMTLKSQFARLLAKPQFKDAHTVRNINTIRKIIA